MSASVSKPWLEQWVEQLQMDDETLISKGLKQPCPKTRRRTGIRKVAEWRKFQTWADPVLQWALIYVPELMSVRFSPAHSELAKSLRDVLLVGLPPGIRRIAEVWPRACAKTRVTGQIGTLWFCCEGTNEQIFDGKKYRYESCGGDHDYLYLTGSEFLAQKTLAVVWNNLRENEHIMADYGKLLKRWPKEGLDAKLENGLWLIGRGMGHRIRGLHPKRMVGDDVEDRENVSTIDTRLKMKEDWTNTVDKMMMEDTYTLQVGNYINYFCLLKHIVGLRSTKANVRAALQKGADGKWESIWPEMWSTEGLLREWDEDPDSFLCEKMNQPIVLSNSPIRLEEIEYYNPEELYQSVA